MSLEMLFDSGSAFDTESDSNAAEAAEVAAMQVAFYFSAPGVDYVADTFDAIGAVSRSFTILYSHAVS